MTVDSLSDCTSILQNISCSFLLDKKSINIIDIDQLLRVSEFLIEFELVAGNINKVDLMNGKVEVRK